MEARRTFDINIGDILIRHSNHCKRILEKWEGYQKERANSHNQEMEEMCPSGEHISNGGKVGVFFYSSV